VLIAGAVSGFENRRGSPEHRFYESLMREAVANIREAQARDEEMLG
jgi:hypothetical protein